MSSLHKYGRRLLCWWNTALRSGVCAGTTGSAKSTDPVGVACPSDQVCFSDRIACSLGCSNSSGCAGVGECPWPPSGP